MWSPLEQHTNKIVLPLSDMMQSRAEVVSSVQCGVRWNHKSHLSQPSPLSSAGTVLELYVPHVAGLELCAFVILLVIIRADLREQIEHSDPWGN